MDRPVTEPSDHARCEAYFLIDAGQRAASVKFLIRDRAGQFTGSFDAVLTAEGTRIPANPPQAPRANAICKRIIGTLRREGPDRVLIVNEHHLRQVLTEYVPRYNTGPAAPCPRPAHTGSSRHPGHPNRSTAPSTRSAGNKSSADSRTSTTPPPYRRLLKRRSPTRIVFPSPTGTNRLGSDDDVSPGSRAGRRTGTCA
jgi:hypothetical protein